MNILEALEEVKKGKMILLELGECDGESMYTRAFILTILAPFGVREIVQVDLEHEAFSKKCPETLESLDYRIVEEACLEAIESKNYRETNQEEILKIIKEKWEQNHFKKG